jgi:hypothetical protein
VQQVAAFNPSKAGGKILNLSYQNVKITDKGVALIANV